MSILSGITSTIGSLANFIPGVGPMIGAGLSGLSGMMEGQEKRDLQEKTWQREDSAVQRRVADLKAAGMSPILAAGSSAASSQPTAGVSAAEATGASSVQRNLEAASIGMNMMKQKADISKTNAETRALEIDNKMKEFGKTGEDPYSNYEKSLINKWGRENWMTAIEENKSRQERYKTIMEEMKTDARYNGLSEPELRVRALGLMNDAQEYENYKSLREKQFYERTGINPVLMGTVRDTASRLLGRVLY